MVAAGQVTRAASGGRSGTNRAVASSEATATRVAQARKDLGRQLAAWRNAVGLKQAELAQRICYSRSTVANVEIGRIGTVRQFWCLADVELHAGGALVSAFDEVDALVRDFHRQTTQARDRERLRRAGWSGPSLVAGPGECACGVTVGRWTGREIRALREALRMPVRAFAELLVVTTATVYGWEHRSAPVPPSLPMQAALDHVLKVADADARGRFVLLVGRGE